MKIAILSDIHSNLEALETAFEYIDKEDISKVYCLGDIVGYGPNPNECIEIIRERCDVVLMGNHDYAALGLANIEYFNDYAKASVFWTISSLEQDNLDYLHDLPFSYKGDNFLLVHASPSTPPHWHYVLSHDVAMMEMRHFEQNICYIGHSHVPIIYSKNGAYRNSPIKIETKSQKYIINVGSIGQPRDGDPKLCFAVLDTENNQFEYIRLDYRVNRTYEKIIKSGLPVFLAERLLKGY
jgi:predicted phosphodiesterase